MFKNIKLGLKKNGVVTIKYPSEPYVPFEKAQGFPIVAIEKCTKCSECAKVCPTNAIKVSNESVSIDSGLCLFCGKCAEVCPNGSMKISHEIELATKNRERLNKVFKPHVIDENASRSEDVEKLGKELKSKINELFGRSLAIREVDAGSCNACEVEVYNAANPVYDVERFGLHIVASPRHADMLVVTGPLTRNMELGLIQTYKATPAPKIVIACGTCAISGGIFKDSYAVENTIEKLVPVDVYIPGCPPRPQAVIQGIMVALDIMKEKEINQSK